MLATPALALLGIVLNFCVLVRVANRNVPSTKGGSKWQVLDEDILTLEERTFTTYGNHLDIVVPPPPISSPIYSKTLRRAEWAYRGYVVKILDLVDGSSNVRTASDITSPLPLPQSPSPTKPKEPVIPASHLPPTLTSPIHPATFEPFPAYDPCIPSVITLLMAQSLGLTWFISCLVYTLVFTWMKNRGSRPRVYAKRPTLTCDVNCKAPGEIFYSMPTVTSIPSYSGSEAGFPGPEPDSHSRGSHIDFPETSRSFPVVIANADGKALFNAEIKLSSNHVVTELSATTSTVSFSIDVVASLDAPIASEWYMPAKDDGGVSAKTDDSIFLLLVRGSSDRTPLPEGSQDSDCTSEPEEYTLPVHQTPPSDAQTLVSDYEFEDTNTRDVAPLGSPMCPITIPIHHRGFSSFETSLINSGTKTCRLNGHKDSDPRHSNNIRPKDVRFAWLKDIYTCGDDHLDGCLCEGILAEDVLGEYYPPRPALSELFYDHDAAPEFNRDTHSGERGSGMHKWAYTVSPGLSVRSEVSPTSISGPAELRPTAHSNPSLADGKELAGLDSTVALMPSFSVASPELVPRCRSSGISTPAEFSDGILGEQSVTLEADDTETGPTGECTGMTRFTNDIRSPPSPVVPEQVDLLLDALEPVLSAGYTSPLSPEGAASPMHLSTFNRLEGTPLQYSPFSVRARDPVELSTTPECDDWVEEPAGSIDHANPEPPPEAEQ